MSNTPTGIWGEDAPKNQDLLRFDSGVPVRLRFTGPAIKFKQPNGNFRFASMVYVYSGSTPTGLRLWLFPWQVQTQVKALFEMSGDPSGYDVAVTVNGSGKQTRYSVSGLAPSEGPPIPFDGSVADLQQMVAAIVKPATKQDDAEKSAPIPDTYDPFADD